MSDVATIGGRPRVALPPTGWRPPPLKVSAKLDIIIHQEGKCALTGERLGSLKETRFDHRPPVHEREWDEAKQDTIPPANALSYVNGEGVEVRLIFAIDRRKHEIISGADNSRMTKVDHVRSSEDEHQQQMKRKAAGLPRIKKGSIRSRGFERRQFR